MIFIVVAAIGIIVARSFGWVSVFAITIILAVAVGIEGAVEARTLFKVLKRGFEINVAFQGAYFAAACALYSSHFLGRLES